MWTLGKFTLFVVIILQIVASRLTSAQEVVEIKLQSGVLQGNKKSLPNNRNYYNFQGIPYALPPIGNLRFEDPIPFKKWNGILNATSFMPTCVELVMRQINYIVQGQEDCLYLNVYTAQNPLASNELLPVMVWLYGGSFREGSSNLYGPDYLMQENVVIVTFNYRLGVFGFLSTQDKIAPGNYGLKDIIEVLKWVQVNIQSFGGDPGRVTIMGESAGAAMAGYLMMTKQAENLFHAVGMQSGSPLCFWAVHRNPRKVAFDFGLSMGLSTNSSRELIQFLKEVDLSHLDRPMIGVNLINLLEVLNNGGPFGIVIEPAGSRAVVTKDSYRAFKNGDFQRVPVLIGLNSQESKYFSALLSLSRTLFLLYDISPSSLVRIAMNVKSPKDRRTVGLEIRKHYFKMGSFNRGTDQEFADFFSDDLFVRPILKTVELMSKYVPVYFYVYDFEGSIGKAWMKYVATPLDNVKGVAHAVETWYLWKAGWLKHGLKNQLEERVSNRLVKLWSNFVNYRNPTPQPEELLNFQQWPAIKGKDMDYFYIGSNVKIGKNYKMRNFNFWNNLYRNYSKGPFDTY